MASEPNAGKPYSDNCGLNSTCPDCNDVCKTLRQAGLRPTRQRIAIADCLFGNGDRHVSAEQLFGEVQTSGFHVSQATIYNTLHQFSKAGLLRTINIDSSKTYFDTNTGNHHHFFLEGSEELLDIPQGAVNLKKIPEPPEGMEVASVDVIVKVRKSG